jgi:hypothetical protein
MSIKKPDSIFLNGKELYLPLSKKTDKQLNNQKTVVL